MLVNVVAYRDGCRIDAGGVAEALSAAGSTGWVWLGLHDPTPDEFDEASERFDLHPLAVEDALSAHQRPKVEHYGDSVFLVLKTARYLDDVEEIDFGEIQLFVGKRFVVAVRHGEPTPLVPVRAALEADRERLACGPAAVVHAVVDAVVDGYGPVLAGLENDVEEVELEVFSDGARTNPVERIYFLKRETLEMHRAVQPLIGAMDLLRHHPLIASVDLLNAYFRDIHDHLLLNADQLAGIREALSDSLDANATRVALRQNEDMRRISAWVAIAVVPTMVAGIYGMNFEHMPELGLRWGYPLVIGAMALVCVTLYRLFRRAGWL